MTYLSALQTRVRTLTLIIMISVLYCIMVTAQVTIKEKVSITRKGSSQGIKTKGGPRATPFTDDDSTMTIVTVAYYYHGCEGYAQIWTVGDSTPCQAYRDTANGDILSTSNKRGVAMMQFVAYDPGHYEFGGVTHYSCPPDVQAYPECASVACNESLLVTDNHGHSNLFQTYPGPLFGYYDNTSAVDCGPNDLQPQSFDPNSVKKYREGDLFYPGGNSVPYVVAGCPLPRTGEPLDTEGMTGLIPFMPNNLPSPQRTWDPVTSTKLSACLDRSANRWRIRVHGLQIPIFSSSCIHHYVDLGNGCDQGILSQYLDSNTYQIALNDLQWWWEGSYSHPPGSHPDLFAFAAGIEAHEYWHYEKDSAVAANEIAAAFRRIAGQPPLQYPLYPCEKNAVDAAVPGARTELATAFGNIGGHGPEHDEEKDADKYARAVYDQIRGCIVAWATSQPWYHN